jgi:hypothetical protein
MINVAIKMKNYGKILQQLQPKLNGYILRWAKEFSIDTSDVESVIYECLFNAIKKFKIELKECQFETYLLTFIRNRLINDAQQGYKEKVIYDATFNPCDCCNKHTLPCPKPCRKFKQYRVGILQLNVLNNRFGHPTNHMEDGMIKHEHEHKLLNLFLSKRPAYKELIDRITQELESGYEEKEALSRTIQNIAKEKKISLSFVYEKVNKMRKWLEKYNEELSKI